MEIPKFQYDLQKEAKRFAAQEMERMEREEMEKFFEGDQWKGGSPPRLEDAGPHTHLLSLIQATFPDASVSFDVRKDAFEYKVQGHILGIQFSTLKHHAEKRMLGHTASVLVSMFQRHIKEGGLAEQAMPELEPSVTVKMLKKINDAEQALRDAIAENERLTKENKELREELEGLEAQDNLVATLTRQLEVAKRALQAVRDFKGTSHVAGAMS